MLDDIDRAVLRQWQADPDMSPAELGSRLQLSGQSVARRIERLRERGILKGVSAIIHWPALGYAVEVSLRVQLDKAAPRAFETFLAAAREIPEVTEMQTFLGRVDLRLNVIARDMGHWQALYRDRILTLPHIAEVEALMHVATVKIDQGLPV